MNHYKLNLVIGTVLGFLGVGVATWGGMLSVSKYTSLSADASAIAASVANATDTQCVENINFVMQRENLRMRHATPATVIRKKETIQVDWTLPEPALTVDESMPAAAGLYDPERPMLASSIAVYACPGYALRQYCYGVGCSEKNNLALSVSFTLARVNK